MATMYRDRITVRAAAHHPIPAPVAASVYVLSAAKVISTSGGGMYSKRTLIVSVPANPKPAFAPRDILRWMGEDYDIEDFPVPIKALGRVDHWEITAQRTVGI